MNEYEHLVEAHLDGDLSAEEAARLEQWLAEDEEHRRVFAARALDHLLLRDVLLAAENKASAATREAILARAWRAVTQPTPLSMTVAALVMGLVITAMAFIAAPIYRQLASSPNDTGSHAPDFVAQLTDVHGAEWAIGQVGIRPGSNLQSGHKMALQKGVAEIAFGSGAHVVLEGPAIFELQSANSGHLQSGKLVARVTRPEAQGFTVSTPGIRVVDLGTEFGVSSEGRKRSKVAVFEGEINVHSRGSNKLLGSFSAGEAAIFEGDVRTNEDFAALAKEFRRGGVAAISVDELRQRVRGLWQFNRSLDNEINVGQPLRVAGFVPEFVETTIDDRPAVVLNLPALTPAQSLIAPNSAGGNGAPGGNARTNDWTLVMDVNFGDSIAPYVSLLQINPANDDDVNIFLRENGSIHLGSAHSVAPGAFRPNTWYRLALRSWSDGKSVVVHAFVNGRPLREFAQNAIDGTSKDDVSLGSQVLLFSDDSHETSALQVNSLAFWHEALPVKSIAALGGPAAGGILEHAPAAD